ncbi:hypothetical protein EV127DRAFT_448623 [Xylaria flabelliformis]|nr:hypothetical protein EV127DRAFT_448623 [Xylaria flabelliformis]
MASSDDFEAKQPEVPLSLRSRNGRQFIQGATSSNDTRPHSFTSCHVMDQARPHLVASHPLDLSPAVKFSGKRFPGMQVGAWVLLHEQTSRIQHEGVVSQEERYVVGDELVKPGNVYSGIFKIISTFNGPDNKVWRMEGTAFAVDKFHALTSAHMMWHAQLGPAQTAVLCPDERSRTYGLRSHIKCIAVAVHAKWMSSHRPENDFCMVAMAQDFEPGVRSPRLELASNLLPFEGEVVGFPLDLPAASEGSQLIVSRGLAEFYQTEAGIMIRHKVNTAGGSSGSPLYTTSKKVVAVHCSFNSYEMENYAVPINLNGNDVSQFQGILRHMRDRLPNATLDLGAATHKKYRKQKIFAFGQQGAADDALVVNEALL